jgi:uncharacterized RDD family membrane protein YckC
MSDMQPTGAPTMSMPNLNVAGAAGAKFAPAGFWIRAGASILDGIIVGVLKAVFELPLDIGIRLLLPDAAKPGQPNVTGALLTMAVNLTIYVIITYYYFGYFYSTRGASPGKSLLNLKVVDSRSGKYLDYWTSFKREVFGKFLSAIILGIGYLMVAFRQDKMAWHDLLFHTRVVKVAKS